MTVRLIQQGVDPLNSAAVVNRPHNDILTGGGYAADGSDYQGFTRGLSGTGSPRSANGNAGLAAPLGHVYTDTSATDGRGHWLKVGTGPRQWQRVKDQVNVAAFVDVVDGATNNLPALQLADAAAAALGLPLFFNPLGTYFLDGIYTFTAKPIVPKGAVLKRSATASITFDVGLEASRYGILDNTAGGTGRFAFTPGYIDVYHIEWWFVLGKFYAVDEHAQWQACDDQTPDGAKIDFAPGMQIRLDYPVRFNAIAKFWYAPPNFADPERGGVMLKWFGDDTGLVWNIDRVSLNTFEGFQIRQMNAETVWNFEMSTVTYSTGVDIITSGGDGYNGVLLPAPWTFKPSDVGKTIWIQASGVGAQTGQHTITEFIAAPSNGVKGSQVRISPAPAGTFSFMSFSLGSTTFGKGIGINTQNHFRNCTINQWDIRNSIDVQGVTIARVSNSNNELHRFERVNFLGLDRVKHYGYQKYPNASSTASMTVGSNVVTLAAAPTGSDAITAALIGKMFRMGRVGTNADATVRIAAPAAAYATTIAVDALTQMIPFDSTFTIHSTVTNTDVTVRTRADAPVGATTITVSALGAGFNTGDTGTDGGRSRANNDGGYGQGQGTITGVLNDHQFTVNFNAPQSVAGLQSLIDCNPGRGVLIGPSFNVHHITFANTCLCSGLYRGIVCYGGGLQVEGVINMNGNESNFEIGGNNAHPMDLGYVNSENSRQHLVTTSGQALEWRGRMSGESTAPGKGQVQVGANAGQKGLDYSNGVCGGFESYAVTGGSTVWDIRNAGGASILSRNISTSGFDSQPLTAQQIGLDAQTNGYVRAENSYGFNYKTWGMAFTATPMLRFGGLPIFTLYQDGAPRPDLVLSEFAFRRGVDSAIYVDSFMDSNRGILTATIRPRRHVVNTRGYAPDASDTLILCQATQFLDSYVTINGNGNLPVDWECSFKRTDTWAQPFHINVNTGCTLNGVVENGTGNASLLLNPGDKVRIACTATGVFETIA